MKLQIGLSKNVVMIGGNVTRTNRNVPNRYPLRNLRSHNEKSHLDWILNDPELKNLPVSKMNRMRTRHGRSGALPDPWDDYVISAYYEIPAEKRRQRN